MIPHISVIMSVYNGQQFLHEAIRSILDQTFSDFEFLITNDGSKDKTPDILKECARKDSRIVVMHQDRMGLTKSLNRMIVKAKGEVIARMDADDVSLPERFEKQIHKLRAKPDYLAVGCWFQVLDKYNMPSHEIIFPDQPELLKRSFYKGINCYAHGGVMIRKHVFEKMELSYRFTYGQDFDLWLRMSERGALGMVEEILYQRRDHSNTTSASLIPRRAGLMNLMLSLAQERKVYGKEISEWQKQEKRIFNKVSLWTEKEIHAYDTFLEARKLLCSGKNTKARRLLSSIKSELNNFENLTVPYYLSYLPGFLTAPFLRLRDNINRKRYFVRTPSK